ncbi:MAG: flagellar basal body P-ring formation chaperone FlgA [Pseudomonadota bacterium]
MKTSSFIRKLLCFSAIAISPFWHTYAANIYHSHENMRQTARNLIEEQLNNPESEVKQFRITFGKIDSRLQFPRCDIPLIAFWPKGSRYQGRTTVGVECTGKNFWKYYLSAKIQIIEKAVISNRRLNRGEVISTGDLTTIEVDITQVRGAAFSDIHEVAGTRVKRTISRNQMIIPAQICAVCRGDRVKISANTETVAVQIDGTARQDGIVGDSILVENLSSRRTIEARITGIGQVQVNL